PRRDAARRLPSARDRVVALRLRDPGRDASAVPADRLEVDHPRQPQLDGLVGRAALEGLAEEVAAVEVGRERGGHLEAEAGAAVEDSLVRLLAGRAAVAEVDAGADEQEGLPAAGDQRNVQGGSEARIRAVVLVLVAADLELELDGPRPKTEQRTDPGRIG